METDESLQLSLLVKRSRLFTEKIVEKFGDGVSDGEFEVHESQHKRSSCSSDSETVASADSCKSASSERSKERT